MAYLLEALIGGLMAGMLYALVAIGFVLIFKASGVFNFAQGSLVLFAALAMARLLEWVPQLLGLQGGGAIATAFAATVVILAAVAWLIQRLCLSKLTNQGPVPMLMATIGISYVIDGVGQMAFGSDIYKIDVGMPKEPLLLFANAFEGGVLIGQEDLVAAGLSVMLVIALTSFFQYSKPGLALRAVADDQKAALSVGIPLDRMWVLAWFIASVVALCAGIVWGSKLGVQFSLAHIALKAIPAVILGGLTSIPGAILGSLLIGVGEKLSEAFIGPVLGGGIETWFAYVLAMACLLIRPQGLLGERAVLRV